MGDFNGTEQESQGEVNDYGHALVTNGRPVPYVKNRQQKNTTEIKNAIWMIPKDCVRSGTLKLHKCW